MVKQSLRRILNDIHNIRGWKTRRKLIVFESDDWGSIRMPDKETYNKLLLQGVRVNKCPFTRYDCLESEDDLNKLFEILCSFKDLKGNHPIFTANCVIANPDFKKIRASGFKEYHFELVTETFKKYAIHASSFDLWQKGIRQKLFYPQFHGREHLNIKRWMKALNDNLPETRLAFDLNMFGISKTITNEKRRSYLEAFSIDEIGDLEHLNKIIEDGLMLFKVIFNYMPKSFIAPNYIWSSDIEMELDKHNIKYIQGQRVQFSPEIYPGTYRRIPHYIGEKNSLGQIYTVRNCHFEPSLNQGMNNVGKCLSQIESAFRWHKPAIIATHRLNFIGTLDHKNRDQNLSALEELLSLIMKKWPDVEFVTSETIGDIIFGS